jgi:hypothetical protein
MNTDSGQALRLSTRLHLEQSKASSEAVIQSAATSTKRKGRNRPPLLLSKEETKQKKESRKRNRGMNPTTLSEKALV